MNIEKFIEKVLFLLKDLDSIDIDKYKDFIYYIICDIVKNVEIIPEQDSLSYVLLLVTTVFTVLAKLLSEIDISTTVEIPNFLTDTNLDKLNMFTYPCYCEDIFLNIFNNNLLSVNNSCLNNTSLSYINNYLENIARNSNHDFIVNIYLATGSITHDIQMNGLAGDLIQNVLVTSADIMRRFVEEDPALFRDIEAGGLGDYITEGLIAYTNDNLIPTNPIANTIGGHVFSNELILINNSFVDLVPLDRILPDHTFNLTVLNSNLHDHPRSLFTLNELNGITDIPRLQSTIDEIRSAIAENEVVLQRIMEQPQYINGTENERFDITRDQRLIDMYLGSLIDIIDEIIRVFIQRNA